MPGAPSLPRTLRHGWETTEATIGFRALSFSRQGEDENSPRVQFAPAGETLGQRPPSIPPPRRAGAREGGELTFKSHLTDCPINLTCVVKYDYASLVGMVEGR